MKSILKELVFRFSYIILCLICLNGLLYLSYGWQWDYFSAVFDYDCENVDFCFNQNLIMGLNSFELFSQAMCSKILVNLTLVQSWAMLSYAGALYFYPLSIDSSKLITGVFLVYQVTFIVLQIYGFLCAGFVAQLSSLIVACWLWINCCCCFISVSLMLLSMVEEFSIERLDSQLQQHFS